MRFRIFFIILFCLQQLHAQEPVNSATLIQRAISVSKMVEEQGRILSVFDPTQPIATPYGIRKTIGGRKYTIAIESVEYIEGNGFLTAYFVTEVPNSDEKIGFYAEKIPFTDEGFSNAVKLYLIGEVETRWGKNNRLKLFGHERKTYVEWDCLGFKSMSLSGELILNPDLLAPADPTTTQVAARFDTEVGEWNDFLVRVSLTPFKLKALEGFTFQVSDAVIDLSDVNNDEAMQFPESYQTKWPELISPLWQGIYIRQIKITFPKQFKSSDNQPSTINANNFIFDEYGLTGNITGWNILSLDKGNAGSWPISVENFSLDMAMNNIPSQASLESATGGSTIDPPNEE